MLNQTLCKLIDPFARLATPKPSYRFEEMKIKPHIQVQSMPNVVTARPSLIPKVVRNLFGQTVMVNLAPLLRKRACNHNTPTIIRPHVSFNMRKFVEKDVFVGGALLDDALGGSCDVVPSDVDLVVGLTSVQ